MNVYHVSADYFGGPKHPDKGKSANVSQQTHQQFLARCQLPFSGFPLIAPPLNLVR